tara:strand:+ start:100 stop:846 length:747 start_codon:yes stop_codon:yes gene_type:complete
MNNNKILFITGSNGQLGSAIINSFQRENWDIFCLDIQESKNKNFVKGSVSDRKNFQKLFGLSLKKLQNNAELCLINNAGVSVFTPSEDRTFEEFLNVSEVNLFGPIVGTTEFYKFYKKSSEKYIINAQIINISSVYGLISPNNSIYTDTSRNNSEIYGATKAGLIQMTKYFAARYANDNIQVNCIAPGGILNTDLQGPEFIENYSKLVPLNRLCEDKEVAELIHSFVSGKFKYVTGQTIPIDGGMTSW